MPLRRCGILLSPKDIPEGDSESRLGKFKCLFADFVFRLHDILFRFHDLECLFADSVWLIGEFS